MANMAMKLILSSATIIGAFLGLVLVFEWLSFLPYILQYSIQFAILLAVGFGLYFVFDERDNARLAFHHKFFK